jgi:carboxypeptidase Taq
MTAAIKANSAYTKLEARLRRLSQLSHAKAMLQWDHATMMPPGGAEARADALSELSLISHEILVSPETEDLLAGAQEEAASLTDWQTANLFEARRTYLSAKALPADLVEKLSQASMASEMAWRTHRAANDFAAMQPHLEKVLMLVREEAAAKSVALDLAPYDALINDYEPGASATQISALFDELTAFLPDLLGQVIEQQASRPAPLLPKGPFAIDLQKALQRQVLDMMGFDLFHGRLDESHHPFSGGVPDDIRMTTRYSVDDLMPGIMATIHETGHSLYELGLPKAWRHQPVGLARSMAMHESQSLIMEMQAGRSDQILGVISGLLSSTFGNDPAFEAGNVRRLYRRVQRSLIRVNADEVSYPLHVILRFRLERAMFSGDLAIADLPGAWADGMKKLVGIVPPDDKDGCLQDIHWPSATFGYFPTYTMGAIAAAQLFAAARRQVPSLIDDLAEGDFSTLLGWLRVHVHQLGRLLPMDEILKRATGAGLGTQVFRQHLETRYLG